MLTAHSTALAAKPVWVVRHVPVGMRFQKSPIQKRAAALPKLVQHNVGHDDPALPVLRYTPTTHLLQPPATSMMSLENPGNQISLTASLPLCAPLENLQHRCSATALCTAHSPRAPT